MWREFFDKINQPTKNYTRKGNGGTDYEKKIRHGYGYCFFSFNIP